MHALQEAARILAPALEDAGRGRAALWWPHEADEQLRVGAGVAEPQDCAEASGGVPDLRGGRGRESA
ncbi:MAG TPA: hypothetical protein VIK91_08430 [Nannocystis sp.]